MNALLDNLLSRLQGVHRSGKEWKALCPAHEDRRASLTITPKDGKVLLHCHAGCETKAVVEAIGLKLDDLFPPRPRATRREVAAYDYTDASGKVLYQAVRFDPKDFKQRRPDGRGDWIWDMKGVRKVLYRLPTLQPAIEHGDTICIVEGEKDVATLESLGLTATTNAGGAGKWLKSYSESLRGADVVVLPDNDKAGKDHAEKIARSLNGLAASVKVVELPDLKPKGDVSDWVKAGGTADDLLGLVRHTPEWTPAPNSETPARADYPFTDLWNAEKFAATHGANLRYHVEADKWLVWNGKLWETDSTGEVDRLARGVVRSLHDLLKDAKTKEERDTLYSHIKQSESAPRLEAMTRLARFCLRVPVQSKDLNRDSWLLNCENGTLELRTGDLRPHRREDLITKIAPVIYDPNTTASRWTRFLEEVFQGDADLIGFVRRLIGYVLTGDTREECVFILTGRGGNGKTKFLEALRHVLGGYAKDAPLTTFIEGRESNTCDLASLVGARLVTAAEGEDTQTFHESLLKRLCGGDPITCRYLYQEYFTYTPTFKVIFCTNEIPDVRSQNYAMRRRLKIIPFRQRFYDPEDGKEPIKDDKLLPKLLAEAPAILAWAIQGCLEWQERGLMTPAVVRHEVEAFFENRDPLAVFLEDKCVIQPNAEAPVANLWTAYVAWCKDTGARQAFKQSNSFSRFLQQRDGIVAFRTPIGDRMLRGVGFSTDTTDKPLLSETSLMKDLSEEVLENTHLSVVSVGTERENATNPFEDAAEDTPKTVENDPEKLGISTEERQKQDSCVECGAGVERYDANGTPYCEDHYPLDGEELAKAICEVFPGSVVEAAAEELSTTPQPVDNSPLRRKLPPSTSYGPTTKHCPRCGSTLGLGGASDWCCKCQRRISKGGEHYE